MKTLPLLVIIICGFVLFPVNRLSGQQPSEDAVFIAAAAKAYGFSLDGLTVVYKATADYPLASQQLRVAKVYDSATQRIVEVAIGERGEVADRELAATNEATLRQAKYGKLAPSLYESLQTVAGDTPVQVAIRLSASVEPVRTPSQNEYEVLGVAEVEQRLAAEGEAKRAEIASLERPVVDWLVANGVAVVHADTLAPWVIAVAPADTLKEIELRKDVGAIYGPGVHGPTLDTSAKTVHAHYAWVPGTPASTRGLRLSRQVRSEPTTTTSRAQS